MGSGSDLGGRFLERARHLWIDGAELAVYRGGSAFDECQGGDESGIDTSARNWEVLYRTLGLSTPFGSARHQHVTHRVVLGAEARRPDSSPVYVRLIRHVLNVM